MGHTVAALWASKEKWPIDSLEPTFRFMLWNLCDQIMESGHMNTTQHRYRLGVFPVPHGSVDSKVFPSSDQWIAGNPWTWKGRTISNSVMVRFHVAEEGNDAGFDVRGRDAHLNSQSHVGHEDLGEVLPASASLDHRTEVVLETTVDDARRVRQIPGVNHISQRKVGQNGRVRITVDMPEYVNSCCHIAKLYLVLVPHSVLLLGCFSTNLWSNGKSCLLCSPKKHGSLVVSCVSHRDGSLLTPPQACTLMT